MRTERWAPFDKWVRPHLEARTYNNGEIEIAIQEIAAQISDDSLRQLFTNCVFNTLDTTTTFSYRNGQPYTYVITGDIEAMWLRDSTLQVKPYLPFVKHSDGLRELFLGLANAQAQAVALDPYANAFYDEAKYGIHASDMTEMLPGVHERKWELDSLCFHLYLLTEYSRESRSLEIFSETVITAIEIIVKTLKEQQRFNGQNPYHFDRITDNPIDTLSNDGHGPESGFTGMVNSSFRPSDDACTYPFHIPSNLFASTLLKQIADFVDQLNNKVLADSCRTLSAEIDHGIEEFGFINHPTLGKVHCYETNGLGDYLLVDDANIPNLMSLPFLGIADLDDPLYLADRTFALSTDNPYFFSGVYGAGIGSPHTPTDHVWPISLITEAITSRDPQVWERILKMLIQSSAETGLLHESFRVSDVATYTRPWFAWCNSYFGELIIHIWHLNPTFLNRFTVRKVEEDVEKK